ncbi:MAG: SPOR domain-containing protein [Gammaproteobacteria bacterium]
MTTALKQRIVGAIFILSLGVILIPLILDKPEIGQEHEKEMLSHVIPDAPALPDVSEVSKIHYVFNDVEPQSPKPTEPAPTSEPPKPTPILIPSDLASSGELPAPLPPLLVENEVSHPLPDDVKKTSAAPTSVSKGHEKASATLAEASQAEWTIQLGAFSSEQNAKALVQKLSKGGFNPYLRQMTQDSLVRVYVSPGIPREQAVDLATKLDTEYGLKGIVVRYFQK